MHRFRRVLPVLVLLLGLWQIGLPAQAQDNLLKNPNFENPYGGIGTADGWDGGSVKSPHNESWQNIDALFTAHAGDKTYEGHISQQMGRGDATFTAAVWQKVENIQAGTKLRFTVWVYVESAPGSNARARVGIDSNNTASPMDDMAWSPYLTTFNTWQQLTVETVVPAGYVTVYIFGTQDAPKPANQVYMDQASLTIIGTGQAVVAATPVPGSTGAPAVPVVPTTPPQVYAPSVSAQDNDASDGIVHTVRPGDTLAAIAVGYHTTVTHIVELNGIDRHAMLSVGQQLIIEPPQAEAPAVEPTTDTSAETVPAASTAEEVGPSEIVAEPTKDSSLVSAQPTSDTAAPATTEEAIPATAVPATTVPATATTQPINTAAPEPTLVAVIPTSTATSVAEAVTSLKAGVCVTFFEDKNQNHFHEEDEAFLAGGVITLNDLQGNEVAAYQTTASSDPYCFTDLQPVSYNLIATAPNGYGLTTPRTLTVSVQVGAQVQVNIGAAQGVTPPATPTLNSTVVQVLPDADATSPSTGLLVLIIVGLVAVVAIVVGVLIFVIRRL